MCMYVICVFLALQVRTCLTLITLLHKSLQKSLEFFLNVLFGSKCSYFTRAHRSISSFASVSSPAIFYLFVVLDRKIYH